jgi:uncharacterized small protein (DUF1192 family)
MVMRASSTRLHVYSSRAKLATAPKGVRRRGEAVDEEELEPRHKATKLRDLAPLAIAELETYITELEAEILRVKDDIAAKRKQRGGAEALFKR